MHFSLGGFVLCSGIMQAIMQFIKPNSTKDMIKARIRDIFLLNNASIQILTYIPRINQR